MDPFTILATDSLQLVAAQSLVIVHGVDFAPTGPSGSAVFARYQTTTWVESTAQPPDDRGASMCPPQSELHSQASDCQSEQHPFPITRKWPIRARIDAPDKSPPYLRTVALDWFLQFSVELGSRLRVT